MSLPNEFKFKIPVRKNNEVYSSKYVEKLEFGDKCEIGKKGYHVSWSRSYGNSSGTTGYLLADVKKCIEDGIWVIVDDTKEKKEKK